MKKFASLLMTVVLLITMLSVFAVPASAVDAAAVMTGTGTCHVEMKKQEYIYIKFTPSVNDDYTFISDLSEDTPYTAKLLARLYSGKVKTAVTASDLSCSAGSGDFCFSYYLEANKTYWLEIQLQNADSGSADISIFKEVTPENCTSITESCIISKPGSYTCEKFIVDEGITLIIGRNAAITVTYYYSNHGKIDLRGRLDLSQTPYYTIKGDINIRNKENLVEPNTDSCSFDVSQLKEVTLVDFTKITGSCVISEPGNYECSDLSVDKNSTLIIGRNVTIKTKTGFSNLGKVELIGKLDISQHPNFVFKGNIHVAENGTLIEANNGAGGNYDYNNPHGIYTGSVFSGGSLWIIIAVAVVAVGGVAALIIVKKKKKKTAESVES